MYCIIVSYEQLFHPPFIPSYIELIVRVNLTKYIHQYTSNINEGCILLVLYLRLNERVWNVNNGDIPVLLRINYACK